MDGYKVNISYASRELTAREKVKFKTTSDFISLDAATQENPEGLNIDYDSHVVLDVHNERSEDKDYSRMLVIDKSGLIYATGSESFRENMEQIVEEMVDAGETEIVIRAFRKPSKNRAGKDFITCELA